MADKRQHRGPHPKDKDLFGPDALMELRAATRDLCWLMTLGYATVSSLTLVGDRYWLTERQRRAVLRSSCSKQALTRRASSMICPDEVHQRRIAVDGFNVLVSVEAAMSGGVVLCGRDRCYRDMASMHGSYRKVSETEPAVNIIGQVLATAKPASVIWLLDRPVSTKLSCPSPECTVRGLHFHSPGNER